MNSKIIFLSFLCSHFSFSQIRNQPLEDKIYVAIDTFIANPTPATLLILEQNESNFNPKTSKEKLALTILKCNKAYYENQFGMLQKAISDYEKAWQIFQENKQENYDITEFCLKPLGNLYTIIGDYDNAESIIKQYYFIAQKKQNHNNTIAAIINLSNAYQCSGRHQTAITLIENTLKLNTVGRQQTADLNNNLGNNFFLTQQFNKAKQCFEKALKSFGKQPKNPETICNIYRNLSSIYVAENNFEQANSCFENAKNYFETIPNLDNRKIAKMYYENANLQYQQGNIELANHSITTIFKLLITNYGLQKKELPNVKMLYADTVLLDAIDLKAMIFDQQKQFKKAIDAYGLCFQIETIFSKLILTENAKIIHQVRQRNRIEKCISIYYNLFQQNNNNQYIKDAFQLSETSKATVLNQYLEKQKSITAQEKTIVQQLQTTNNNITKEQQKGQLANINLLNAYLQEQNKLMLLLKSKDSATENFASNGINLEALWQRLDTDNATMLCYFMGAESIYLFQLKNDSISLQKLDYKVGKNKIITQFLHYFTDAAAITNDVEGYLDSGNKAYQFLKIPKENPNKHLIIITDGVLNFLPFEALITQKTSTTNFSKINYLLKDYCISYQNSAGFYLNNKPLTKNKNTVLGVFPIFAKTDYELTFSKKEMQSIKDNFDGKYLENENATYNNFKQYASQSSILHLSTHGNSGDMNEPASIKFYDQEILYSELYLLQLNPQLVVLSACETGVGKNFKSEGAMSVARGFQYAGAANLLFSLWKVNDFTTAVLMDKFYKNIQNKSSFAVANQQAKINFLEDKSIPNTKKSPYYWSAFVYYGTIDAENNYTVFWTLLLFAIGFSGIFILKKSKKTIP